MLKFAISGKGGIKEMVKMKQMPNIDYLELLRFVVCLDNMVSQTYPCILVHFLKFLHVNHSGRAFFCYGIHNTVSFRSYLMFITTF